MDKDVKGTFEGLLAQITTNMLVQSTTAPFNRTKILLETQKYIPGIPSPYKDVRDCLHKIRHEEGFVCFWRGNLAGILRSTLRFSTTFTLYGLFLSKGSTATLDAIVDIMGMWVSYPLHVARVRLAADVEGEFGGIEDSLVDFFQKSGFEGAYTGFGLSVLHSFVKTISIKYLNKFVGFIVDKITRDESLRLLIKYILRPLTNITALVIAYPLDIIKNTLILRICNPNMHRMAPFECFRHIVETEGYKGLYKGILAEILVTYISSLPFEEMESSLRDQIWRLIRKYF